MHLLGATDPQTEPAANRVTTSTCGRREGAYRHEEAPGRAASGKGGTVLAVSYGVVRALGAPLAVVSLVTVGPVTNDGPVRSKAAG